jgi:glutathione S-transferase
VEAALAGRDYLVGTYSLADITFIPVFTRMTRYGFTLDRDLPRVNSWRERLLQRPAVQSTLVAPQA